MYTCDKCGKEFELPVMADTGGEYGNTPYTEPASPCCEDNFEELDARSEAHFVPTAQVLPFVGIKK